MSSVPPQIPTFNRKPCALKYARRKWLVSPFWEKQFPINEQGEVSFSPPWKDFIYKIENKSQAYSLMTRLRTVLVANYIALAAGLTCIYYFCAGNVYLLTIMGIYVVLIQQLVRNILLKLSVKNLLANLTPLIIPLASEPTRQRLNWQGKPMPFTLLTIIDYLILWATISFSTIQAWSVLGTIHWSVIGPILLVILIGFTQTIFKKRHFVLNITLFITFSVLGAYGCITYYRPTTFKEVGTWGEGNQSPISYQLGFYQDFFSADSLDKRLQYHAYRAWGTDIQLAVYFMPPQEFKEFITALRRSPYLSTGTNRNTWGSQPDYLTRNLAHFHYPTWWLISPALLVETLHIACPYRQTIPLSAATMNYRFGNVSSVNIPSGTLLPGREYNLFIFYNKDTEMLYVESIQIPYTPREKQ